MYDATRMLGQVEHDIEHDFFNDRPQTPCTCFFFLGPLGNCLQTIFGELQIGPFHAEQLLILLHQRILRLTEHPN